MMRRWYLVVVTGMVVILVELEEHMPLSEAMNSSDFWRETILFGVILPVTYGFLFGLLQRIRADREAVSEILDRQTSLGQQLSQMSRWNDITATIVNFPSTLLPVAATTLHIYHAEDEQFHLADRWMSEAARWPNMEQKIPRSICQRCLSGSGTQGQIFKLCQDSSDSAHPKQFISYCLPLSQGRETVAILHLYFPSEPALGAQAVRTLTGSASEMALAIERARLEAAAQDQAEATSAERRRIARDLHDTLGQNVSYLRLKLDEMTGEDALGEISTIRNELERMRDIASDAYSQVRSTLDELQPECPSDLAKSLRDHLRLVGERAGFKPAFHTEGGPRALSAHTRRQVMYIFREILSNIEKHAQAKKVRVELLWKDMEMVLRVADDGRGFDLTATPQEGHYGLGIMLERAEEISGSIGVHSSPGKGVRVTLQVPLEPTGNGAGFKATNGATHYISKN
jgi:signal transduction histidine kinase